MEWLKRSREKIGDWKGTKKKPTWNLLDGAVEDAVDIHHNKRAFIYLRVTW